MRFAPFGDKELGVGQLTLLAEELLAIGLAAVDDIVLEPLRPGEHQDFLGGPGLAGCPSHRKRRCCGSQPGGTKEIATIKRHDKHPWWWRGTKVSR